MLAFNISEITADKNKIPLSYYFDSKTKQNIIKKVIDNYLDTDGEKVTTNNPEKSPVQRALRNCKTAEQNKRKKKKTTMVQSEIIQ